jgi:hypothetical protein
MVERQGREGEAEFSGYRDSQENCCTGTCHSYILHSISNFNYQALVIFINRNWYSCLNVDASDILKKI